jgi:hypothetical protein
LKKNNICICLTIALALLPAIISAQSSTDSELSDIIINKTESQLEVNLVINPISNYESFTLFNPNRLVIDLLQVNSFTCEPEIEINDSGVQRVRTAKNQPDVTRIVFDLEENIPSYYIEEKEDGIFLYFEIEPSIEKKEEKPDTEKPAGKVEETPIRPEIKKVMERERLASNQKLGISINSGLYFPHDADFQDVYGSNMFSLGGGLSFLFPLSPKEDLGIALDFNYMSAKGSTSYTDEEIKFSMIPLSLTIFYSPHFGKFSPFAGIGGDYYNYREEYPETFTITETTGSLLGYNLLLGTHLQIAKSIVVKVYFKLHMAKKTENEIKTNLSGNEYGISLIYFFRL